MKLTTTILETAANPTASIIWMHGLGADGNDFVPIVKELALEGCPAIRFVFPNAPRIPVTVNGGYSMPAWYDIRTNNITAREDENGVRNSQAAIEALIQDEKTNGAKKIILAGFSQGGAMALHTGLRHAEPLAGILCLSGYLPLPHTVAEERQVANLNTSVFMAHGELDPVVPLQFAEKSRDLLKQLGYKVEWCSYPMEHTVCLPEILDISAWLRRVLK